MNEKWIRCYRISQHSSVIEAKLAKGGECCGHENLDVAKLGEWLCRNPENGYTWKISREGFEELYCEVGKTPKVKPKKQQDGHRKGKSRHMSASSKAGDETWGSLFESEENDEEEGDGDGDVV